MEEHQLENPSNARIFINYNNEEKVRFEYPCKKSNFEATKRVFYNILHLLSMGVGILFLTLIVLGVSLGSGIILLINFIFGGLFIFIIISTPLIIYILSKSKWFIKRIPEINKMLTSECYYKKVEKLEKPEFEIEYFDNIFLDYKTEGEFGKYLERIEITEYPFEIIKKRLFGKSLKERQDFIWKAKFYFKQIPTTGYLEVNYY